MISTIDRCVGSGLYLLTTSSIGLLLCFSVPATAKDCIGRDQCSCQFDDGGLVALNSLGNSDLTPKFQDVISADGDKYSYNPCYPFSEGTQGDCQQAAACSVSALGEVSSIGDAQTAQFKFSEGNVVVGYHTGHGIITSTQVILKCDQNACEPSIVADGAVGLTLYQFTVTTVCACPNGCTENGPVNCKSRSSSSSGIGGGVIFLIVFCTFAGLYFVGGTIFMAVGRKAKGKEMIPNVGFWSSLPGLIKDGVLFVLKPCVHRGGYTSK